MVRWSRRIAGSQTFRIFTILVIAANAVLLGLETLPAEGSWEARVLGLAGDIILGIFVVELAIRIVARWPRPFDFFRNGWNVFDFTVVAVSFLPGVGNVASVARLARLPRLLRLFSAVPQLRLIIGTLMRSLSSIGAVMLLMGVVIYVYAIVGFQLFKEADPRHWGSLGAAVLTLFEILSGGWLDRKDAVLGATPFAWIYFASYVLIAIFVVLNLFVAVVLANLEDMQTEQRAHDATNQPDLLLHLAQVRADLEVLESKLRRSYSGQKPREPEADA